jgi:hypothetical protein
MDEITFDDKTYVSSKRAAQITGYAKDYIGQLCREGRVGARLVGRNWYVLESSIREHRFGAEAPKAADKPVEVENTAWESPTYASETVSSLPTASSVVKMAHELAREAVVEPVLDHSNTVQEMQSAWQDWFSARNITSPQQLEENLLENPEDSADAVHIVKMDREIEPEPVAEEEEVEVVPIHRSFAAQTHDIPTFPTQPIRTAVREQPPYVPAYVPEYQPQPQAYPVQRTSPEPLYGSRQPEGRILRERRVIKKKKPSMALQALFLCIAAVSIAIALIGTGEMDTFINQNRLQYAPINFFGGEAILNRASK